MRFKRTMQRRRADDRIFDQKHPLAFEHFAQRRVFRFGLAFAVAAPFDERPAAVAIADQPFHAGDFQRVGHRVGRGLARVGHGHDDRVLVDRHRFEPGQFLAQPLARKIDAAVVQRAGHVGEINPLEETMGVPRALGELLHFDLAVRNDDRRAGRHRLDPFLREAEIQQRHALAGGGEQRAVQARSTAA